MLCFGQDKRPGARPGRLPGGWNRVGLWQEHWSPKEGLWVIERHRAATRVLDPSEGQWLCAVFNCKINGQRP